MKKTICLFTFLLGATIVFGQVKFGIKAGFSSTNLNTEDLRILDDNGFDRFTLALNDSDIGFFGGFLVQMQFGALIVQPEFYFNSNSSDFEIDDPAVGQIFKEKYQFLDIPILVGCKFGPLRIMAGPQGNVFLGSTTGLLDFDGYRQDFKGLTLGWQGGIGVDLWNLMIDIRYAGNFTKFGDHINFGNRQYEFDKSQSSLLFSAAWVFGG